ncbi:MAG: hypothetical protein M3Z19_00735 [Chloroflexota bacterium]|nr:hypothetical protein [Chloroflexota bacterium]
MSDGTTNGKRDGAPDDKSVLTTRQGHPVHNNRSQRTVGSRSPAMLENYPFLFIQRHAAPSRWRVAEGLGMNIEQHVAQPVTAD